jgi:hypothetical protein
LSEETIQDSEGEEEEVFERKGPRQVFERVDHLERETKEPRLVLMQQVKRGPLQRLELAGVEKCYWLS